MKDLKKLFSWAVTLLTIMVSCSNSNMDEIAADLPMEEPTPEPIQEPTSGTEKFTFISGGINTMGKIYLPSSQKTNNDLPAIYLLDYQEQHYEVTTDEFERVIESVKSITGLDALVVTLVAHPDIVAVPSGYHDYYDVFKDMTSYVDANYTNNTSRTFIGKGSEAGVVLLALLSENQASSVFNNFIATDSPPSFNEAVIELIDKNKVPEDLVNKKLHFSFSTSNDRNSCNALINSFENAQYAWLKFESIEYTTSDYNNTYPISFAAGLKFVFKK